MESSAERRSEVEARMWGFLFTGMWPDDGDGIIGQSDVPAQARARLWAASVAPPAPLRRRRGRPPRPDYLPGPEARKHILVPDLSGPGDPRLRAWVEELDDLDHHVQVCRRLDQRATDGPFETIAGVPVLDLVRDNLHEHNVRELPLKAAVLLVERLTIDAPVARKPEDAHVAAELEAWCSSFFWPWWFAWTLDDDSMFIWAPDWVLIDAANMAKNALASYDEEARERGEGLRDTLQRHLRRGGRLHAPYPWQDVERPESVKGWMKHRGGGAFALPYDWAKRWKSLRTHEEFAAALVAERYSMGIRKTREALALARAQERIFRRWWFYRKWLAGRPDEVEVRQLKERLGVVVSLPARGSSRPPEVS